MKIISAKPVKVRRKDSMPDIDVDFEGRRRDDVKKYIEDKYTYDNVCSIGTYNRMKAKSAIKDLVRNEGADFAETNTITKLLNERPTDPLNWGQIFEQAQFNPKIKKFIQKYPNVFKNLKPILLQTRSSSVHPSAVVIVPKVDEEGNEMKIWDWLPVRLEKEKGVIISEWEGKYMDIAGFLKEDILGIAQLDKFRYIVDLIKENRGIDIDFTKIPLDDEATYEYFQKGWNEDVFQFGTGGLKSYCAEVKPENIEELIAINALYRPGPMGSGAHKDFVSIKKGRKKPIIDIGMESVTGNTSGLYLYQEQVMQGMVVGGMSLVESDIARTAIKKFDKNQLDKFENKFIKNYSKITESEKEAKKVWDKMLSFSSYGFNRSHAAAYSIMGYHSQYLKVHFPLEFWTASLNFCDYEEETPSRIAEINKTKESINIKPPDINKSKNKIVCDVKTNSIYYSLVSIKGVGDVASKTILDEREVRGEFFSLEEFLKRINKSKVNKTVVVNLILAGAFDETCLDHSSNITNRKDILVEYFNYIKQPLPEQYTLKTTKSELFWRVKQKELTGLGKIDYKKAAIDKGVSSIVLKSYVDFEEFQKNLKFDKDIIIGGRVLEMKEKVSKNKKNFVSLKFETNAEPISIQIWEESGLKENRNLEKLENSLKNKSYILLRVKPYKSGDYVGYSSQEDLKIIEL